jgi:hypothetical protein
MPVFIVAFLIVLAEITLPTSLNAEKTPDPFMRVAPYMIAEDHPIKQDLDAFFSQERWIFNEKTLKSAGFSSYNPRKFSRVVVAKHDLFPGYVFKMYMDVQRYQSGVPEWELWALRVEGSNLVREILTDMGWDDWMKTPHKWIYCLPAEPKPPKGYVPKRYILVQEDMDLLSAEENVAKWGSDEITHELLDKLYYVLKTAGLYDCAKIHNVPFAKDGRIAFIDTQGFNSDEVSWEGMNNYLNKDNRAYWLKITRQKQ